MKLSQLEYTLPKELIANGPATPRDHSRLMVIDRKTKLIIHKHFFDLPDFLTANDVLVFNQTKVFPAKFENLLLLREIEPLTWKCIFRGKPNKPGRQVLKVNKNFAVIKFEKQPKGSIPLPPYIKSNLSKSDLAKKYQTVYAKNSGSVAAPTAGFHFTASLLKKLKLKGVQMEFVTLHVGPGTFFPVKADNLEDHKMHSEFFTLDKDTANRLNEAKVQGKRIIAIGTTTTRVLETIAIGNLKLDIGHLSGKTAIFIYPPYKFKFVDALITNFHLPHSTLLALVYAFAAPNLMRKAYKEAIEKKYRFYSFGDSMFIS